MGDGEVWAMAIVGKKDISWWYGGSGNKAGKGGGAFQPANY